MINNNKRKRPRGIVRGHDICPLSQVNKRVISRIFYFVFACLLAFTPLLASSTNKVSALSNPVNVSQQLNTVYTGSFNNFVIDAVGINRYRNINPTELLRYETNPHLTLNGYGSYGGEPTTRVVTKLEQTRTDGANISNEYYDGNEQYDNIIIRQTVTEDNQLYINMYRMHNINFYLTQPTLVYDFKNTLSNMYLWYYNPLGYSDNDVSDVSDNAPTPFNMRTSNEITYMRFEINFSYQNIDNVEEKVNYVYNTNLNSLESDSAVYIPSTILDKLDNAPMYNKCILLNSFNMSVSFWQRPYLDAILSYDDNARTFNALKENDLLSLRYQIPLYANNIYMILPFHNEPLSTTLPILEKANKLYYEKLYNDYNTINDLWLTLIDFEIFPNFKLSYFLYMGFGIILIISFVRLFR